MRCAAITRAGTRCRLEATLGSYCYQHAPETAERRKQRASKGGRTGGNGRAGGSELAQAKGMTKGLVTKLLRGEVGRETATACFMGLNVLARYIEIERRVKELEDLEAQMREIEQELKERGQRFGA